MCLQLQGETFTGLIMNYFCASISFRQDTHTHTRHLPLVFFIGCYIIWECVLEAQPTSSFLGDDGVKTFLPADTGSINFLSVL